MGVLAATGHVDLPLVGIAGHRFRVDGAQNRLSAEGPGRIGDELRVRHGRRVHRHLVGAGGDHLANIGHAAEAAAHAVWEVQLGRGVARELHRGGAVVARGGDVQEDHLVGLLLVVGTGQLDGVARIAQPHEVHALHDAAVLYVQAGDYSLCQHLLSTCPSANQTVLRFAQTVLAGIEGVRANRSPSFIAFDTICGTRSVATPSVSPTTLTLSIRFARSRHPTSPGLLFLAC